MEIFHLADPSLDKGNIPKVFWISNKKSSAASQLLQNYHSMLINQLILFGQVIKDIEND